MKLIIKLYVILVYACRALVDINRPKLGDSVTYQGKIYHLIQGVNSPRWDLFGDGQRINYIHQNLFKLQPVYKRFWFSFKSTFNFYYGYWFQIDVRNKGKFIFRQQYEKN